MNTFTVEIKIPRNQDGMTFTDEAWKAYCDKIAEKHHITAVHHDYIRYIIPANNINLRSIEGKHYNE